MRKHLKLSDVFKQYSGIIQMRANAGKPYSVLVSDADKQSLPKSYSSYEQADRQVTELGKLGINAATVRTEPFAKNTNRSYTLFIKPQNNCGTFGCY